MIIKPRFKGFICTTAHPAGCAQNVKNQINYVNTNGAINGPKKVLVIGASTGYGLASRIVSTFGAKASNIGVVFEKPASEKRTATAGWYNTAAFEKMADDLGCYSKVINGDAFSNETKDKTIELIKESIGEVDLVIYSLASPKRVHPVTGETLYSTLKSIGKSYSNKTMDFHTCEVSTASIDAANEDEIRQTIAVMGGEDWQMWIEALLNAGVLAKGALTVAYSYIGSELTYPVYREGTIGKAKEHLEATSQILNDKLNEINGKAFVAVNKALVTQSSSAIPIVPLYIAALSKVMKNKGIDEGCIEQIYRLFKDGLYGDILKPDDKNRLRVDNLEMREDVQKEIFELWDKITTENVRELTDIEGFREDFFKLFGFGYPEVCYEEDIEHIVSIANLVE